MNPFTPEGMEKLRKIMSENPEVFSMITGKKTAGRPKGAKSSTTITPGKVIEIVQPTEVANAEAPIPITPTEAKRLLKQTKKPRNLSEEAKQKMLENLRKGREKLQQKKEEQKAREQQAKQQEEEKAKKEVVIKKYIIKPRNAQPKPLKRKFQDSELEHEETEVQTEDFTEGETDLEMYKKLKRQERLLKKIQKVKETVQTPAAKQQVSSQKVVKNPFFYN